MKKESLKIKLDILLTLLLVFCMGMPLWPLLAHEIAGTIMFICLAIHTWLNWSWYRGLFKGRYTAMRWIILAVAVCLWLDLLALAFSSLSISYYVFKYMPSLLGARLGRNVHLVSSYWGIVLMSIHLGLHWSKFAGKLRVDWSSTIGKGLRVLGLLAAVYGLYSFWKFRWLDYMWLNVKYVSFAGLDSPWIFYPTCLCIMAGGVFIGFYWMKFMRKKAF